MHKEPTPHTAPKSVMLITGDASGDLHGSRLVKAMREKDRSLFFFGIGEVLISAADGEAGVVADGWSDDYLQRHI